MAITFAWTSNLGLDSSDGNAEMPSLESALPPPLIYLVEVLTLDLTCCGTPFSLSLVVVGILRLEEWGPSLLLICRG